MEQFVIKMNYSKDDISYGYIEIGVHKENANDSLIWISDLYVNKGHRHIGIGTALMNKVIDTCKKLSITRVYLWCIPKLIPFYKNFGAEDTHLINEGYHFMRINIK